MRIDSRLLTSLVTLSTLAACASAPHADGASFSHPAHVVAPAPLVTGTTRAPLPMRYADDATEGPTAIAPPDPARKAKLLALAPKLDALFQNDLDANHYSGMGVGIVLDGELVYARGFGVRDRETKAPFEHDTLFRIASVTKGFAVMAILKLRDEGKLLLDEPAARYYPPLAQVAYPTRDSAPITVRELLTHGSGLPEDNYWVDAAGNVDDAKLARMLASGMTFSRAPNTSFEYSNTGFALIGKIIESVSGMPTNEYIRREILLPLGMTASTFDRGAIAADRLSRGYRGDDGYRGKDTSYNVAPVEPMGVYDAAGGLFSSIRDMSRYMAFHLAAWPPRSDRESGPLRRSSVREMHVPARQGDVRAFPRLLLPGSRPYLFGLKDNTPSIHAFNYGLGLFVHQSCDDDLEVEHGGGLPGYTTSLWLYPKRGYGIVLFINDERVSSDPERDATRLLREAGVIDSLEEAPVPALDAARAEVERLLASWESSRADALFEPTFWTYQSREKLQAQLSALSAAHGACRSDGTITVTNRSRGSWRMACERGEITFAAALAPEASRRLQTLLWEDAFPPSAVLTRAASGAVGMLDRWDETAAKRWLAPAVDARATKKAFARVALERHGCKIDKAVTSDGATTARFRLACTEGGAELSITIDPKSERITRMRSALERTSPNCAF